MRIEKCRRLATLINRVRHPEFDIFEYWETPDKERQIIYKDYLEQVAELQTYYDANFVKSELWDRMSDEKRKAEWLKVDDVLDAEQITYKHILGLSSFAINALVNTVFY